MTLTIDLTPSEGVRLAEVARQRGAAPEKWVRTLVREQLTPAGASGRNEAALATLRDVAGITQGMPETDGSGTEESLRRGRAGGTYGPQS